MPIGGLHANYHLLREPGETPLKRSRFHGPSPTVVVGPGCEDEAVDERVVIFMTYRTSCNCWLRAMGHGAFVRSSREKHNPEFGAAKIESHVLSHLDGRNRLQI